MSETTINITTIDGLTDQIITDQRVKQVGLHMIDLVTDDFYRRIDDYDYNQQRVQSISWDKYEIQFVSIETYGLELLRYAKKITIDSYNGTLIHDARVINIASEKVSDSDFHHTTIEYYDRNLDNYKYAEPPVHNFLRSDAIAEQFPISQRSFLRVVDTEANYYDFNTMLSFVTTAKAPENANFVNTQTGQTITTNSIIKKQINGVFYLNSEDIQPFQSLLPLADDFSIKAFFYLNGNSYSIEEVPEVTVEKLAGWDIYKGSVDFVYSITNHYSYSQAQAGGGGS